MKFVGTTIAGNAVQLLLVHPDWLKKYSVKHKLDTKVDEGRTTIEDRYPLRAALLLTQTCSLQPYQGEADDWRKGLAAMGTNRLAMPLWRDAMPAGNWNTAGARIYDPKQIINFDPVTDQFQIYAASSLPSLGSLPYPLLAPVIFGYWTQRPPADLIAGALGNIDIVLQEGSPYSCRCGVLSVGSGWTANPDWLSGLKDASDYGLELIEAQTSTAREPALDRVNAASRWMQQGGFTFADSTEIATALTCFVNQRGSLLSWAGMPAWFQPGAPTSDTPNSYTVRFMSDELELIYQNPILATAQIGFVQEVNTGARSQSQPGQAYLYQLQYLNDPTNPELYSNFDCPITVGAQTFNPAQVDLKNLRLSLRPQDEKAEVDFPFVAGSLLDDWKRGRLYAWVTLTIWKVNADTPPSSLPDPLFCGFVIGVVPNGTIQQVTATLFGQMMARRIPTYVFGMGCNTQVFSRRCGLTQADYQSAGVVGAGDITADGMTINTYTVTGWSGAFSGSSPVGGSSTFPVNWFAGGTLITGTGRKKITALIMASAPTTSGNVTLGLSRRIFPDMFVAGVGGSGGQAAVIVPGCDGNYASTCIGKFNNGPLKFRAFPFQPVQFQSVTPATGNTAKK